MATTLYGSGEERQMWLERVDLAYQIVLLFQDSRFDQVIVPLVSSYIKRFSFCWLRSINSISGISKGGKSSGSDEFVLFASSVIESLAFSPCAD